MSLCAWVVSRTTGSFPSLPFGHQNAAQPTNCGGNAADGRQQPAELVDTAWRGRGQGGAPKNERIGRKRMGKLASGRQALVVGAVCLAVLFLWPRLGTMGAKVPSSLVAVIVGMIMVPLFGMNVSTIGNLYTINAGLPELHVPQLSIDLPQGKRLEAHLQPRQRTACKDHAPRRVRRFGGRGALPPEHRRRHRARARTDCSRGCREGREGGVRREGGLERPECERRSSTTMPDRQRREFF